MHRSIVGFHQDQESHWVAELDCGHAQHTRHDPPFFPRPWVVTEEGRSAYLGRPLDCVRCDRREMPDGYAPGGKTPTFDAASVPASLKSRHATPAGVWALIHVVRGRVRYRTYAPLDGESELVPSASGVIVPGVEHDVLPLSGGAFFVEFWRAS